MSSAPDGEWEALAALPHVPPDRTLRYGPHPSQVVDLYGEGPRRVTVLHGGYWREAYDRAHLAPFAAALATRGYAVALVEYRRVGGGGGWPATAEDVGAALALLEEREPLPHVVFGHSAGGQLALWAASRRALPQGRVVALAPVADLARAHELRLSDGAVAEFLGGGEALPALLPGADPVRLPPRVPVHVLHGEADPDVPVDLSRRYAAAHDGVRLELLPGTGHFAPLTPGTPAFGRLLAALAG